MNSQAIEDFSGLLKNELSAIEAYTKVLSHMNKNGPVSVLEECLEPHQDRAKKLQAAISKLGGQPITDTGLGGKIAKLIIGGAEAISDEAMIDALGEDEGGWSSDYEWRLVSLQL